MISRRAPKGERADLRRIRERFLAALRTEAAESSYASTRAEIEARLAYYEGRYGDALTRFEQIATRRYPDIGRAMALASLARNDEAETAFRRVGFWCEGGSLEGHRLAGYACLARYPRRLDEFIPIKVAGAAPDAERAARIESAAQAAGKAARLSMLAALAMARGRTAVAYKQVRAGLSDGLAADVALCVGDIATAKTIYESFRKSAASSWFTPSGNATKAAGFVGSAACERAEGQYTRALGFANKALELDKDRRSETHRRALLVAFACSAELGLDSARALRKKLHAAAPLVNVQCGDLSLDELEEQFECFDPLRRAADAGDEVWADDRAAAIPHYAKALRLGRKVRASIKLGERRDRVAARLLYALCEVGGSDATHSTYWERAESIALACVAGTPDFLNGLEVAAWAAAKRGDRLVAKRAFAAAGLSGRWDGGDVHGSRRSLAQWMRLPLPRALRVEPASRAAQGRVLVEYGLSKPALELYDAYELPKDSEDRFFAAWARWTAVRDVSGECPTGKRFTKKQRTAASRAWASLEPLIKARWEVFYQRQPYDAWVLAVELLHAMGEWERLLEVAYKAQKHWSSSYYKPVGVGLARTSPMRSRTRAHSKCSKSSWVRTRAIDGCFKVWMRCANECVDRAPPSD